MNVNPDRAVDAVGVTATAAVTGFLPVDFETWSVVVMAFSAAAYYLTRTYLNWQERKKKDQA